MRHFHLSLGVRSLRALKKNLKDQYRAVYNTYVRRMFLAVIDSFLQVTYLARTQLVIKNHHIYRVVIF